jgi:hypothetical protein
MRRARWALLLGGLVVGGPVVLLGTGAASAARKKAPPDGVEYRPPQWGGMRVSLEVLVGGRPLRTVEHEGKTYLPVPRLGAEYELRVRNHGPRRVTAVVSVDGLLVINGKPASESHPGYIVAPRSSVVIKGWRRDVDKVAAFSFEERENSYAARVGRPENVGVIGLVAFEEMTGRPPPLPGRKDLACSAKGTAGEVGGTGTGYGRDVDSRVVYVPFVRSANRRTVTLYYDTAEALRRAGVPVGPAGPVPFPGDTGFVPPPGPRGFAHLTLREADYVCSFGIVCAAVVREEDRRDSPGVPPRDGLPGYKRLK